jgi:hypothetical protein
MCQNAVVSYDIIRNTELLLVTRNVKTTAERPRPGKK